MSEDVIARGHRQLAETAPMIAALRGAIADGERALRVALRDPRRGHMAPVLREKIAAARAALAPMETQFMKVRAALAAHGG